ncbi:hypothetical protein C0431_12370 [bacterium]|nr:hypothetical protein [bacterium]
MSIRTNQAAYLAVRRQSDTFGDQFRRSMDRHDAYKKNAKRLLEEVIDLRSAIAFAENRDAMIEWVSTVEKERRRNVTLENETRSHMQSSYGTLRSLVYELAVAEIEKGGFYAHVVGTDGTVLKDEDRRVYLEKKGSYTIPFASPLKSFNDSTNIKIYSDKGR